jgi:GNAT superfamily N-acetyltransferase
VSGSYTFSAVSPGTAVDLASFSRAHGKFRYCSCMRWRATSSDFARLSKEERAAALHKLARSKEPVGMLAYHQGVPVGWCSMAPRESYAALEHSRVLPRVDDQPVWSVVCFFLDRNHRGLGLCVKLLAAAIKDARSRGATVIEAYPWPGGTSYRYMGTREIYSAAGFVEVPRPKGLRPVMRLSLQHP